MCPVNGDGANTGNASQQDVTNIPQRQREQHRVAYPTIRITIRSIVAIIKA